MSGACLNVGKTAQVVSDERWCTRTMGAVGRCNEPVRRGKRPCANGFNGPDDDELTINRRRRKG